MATEDPYRAQELASKSIPGTIAAWERWAVGVLIYLQQSYLNALDWYANLLTEPDANATQWTHAQLVFGDPLDQDRGNDAVTTFDVINITNGAIDNSWTQTDYDQVDAALSSIAMAWLQNMPTRFHFMSAKYYPRSFNDVFADHPYPPVGPPAVDVQKNLAGLNATPGLPGQVSMTVTKRTAAPRHWGRNYWPFPSTSILTDTGHIHGGAVDAMANATKTAFETLSSQGFHVVVPTLWANKIKQRALQSVTGISVDNVWDIQRRRRLKHSSYVITVPIPASTKPAA